MARAFLFVLDSFGIGGSADAEAFGDLGSNTYGHILNACAEGRGDRPGLRAGPLDLPVMRSLGLGLAAATAVGANSNEPAAKLAKSAFHAAAQEVSSGKDRLPGLCKAAAPPSIAPSASVR